MTTFSPPVCMWCAHFRGDRKCDAFPGGIPELVWTGGNPHLEKIKGDHGVIFEPSTEPIGIAPEEP
jgi:hypothetical protein